MLSQGLPSTFLGPYSSDFLSSEPDMDEPASSLLILEQPQIVKEVEMDLPSPTSDSIQIAEIGFDSSEEQDNGDQVVELRLYALDLPCQRILGDSNTVSVINNPSIKSSGVSAPGISSCLVVDVGFNEQRRSEISQANESLSPRQVNNEVSEACGKPSDAQLKNTPGIEDSLSQPLVGSDVGSTSSLDPISLQRSHSDIVSSPPSRALTGDSALIFSPSSNLQYSSHQVNAKSCEPRHISSTETFKSPEGQSDDILSRPDFDEYENALQSDTHLREGSLFENPSDMSTAPLETCTTSHLSDEMALTEKSYSSEHDTLTDGSSLTAARGQPGQSHEKTDVTSVSDHFNIRSSWPTAQIEYLQSNPYFEPTTITRALSPHIRTEVVGTQILPSSSPPSSPSMSSNYLPSSSPIPISSPIEGSSQTPSSSPVNSDAYIQAAMTRGASQEIYAAENYSAFPHYSMDRMYYKPPEQTEIHESSFLPTALHQLTSPSGSLTSSYSLDYFDQLSESTTTISDPGQYNQSNANHLSSPIHSTSGTSRFSIEPISSPPVDATTYSNSQVDSNRYDPTLYTPTQHMHNQYESTPYDSIPYDSTQYDSIPHENIQPQSDVNSTVDIPQAPDSNKPNVIPRPKRTTLAGQRLQQKKLSKPFRSPVIHAPVRLAPKPAPPKPSVPVVTSTSFTAPSLKDGRANKSAKPVEQPPNAVASSSQTTDTNTKHRTTRASSQFKSPLTATSTPLDQATLVRLTPTIQSLERKLQLLRRALKVREDVQEEVLEGLVKKWSEVGREAAWEVWDVVKDNSNSDEGRSGRQEKGKRAIEESWGWDEAGDPKKPKLEESSRNWGWDVVPVSDHGAEEANPEEEHEPTAVADSQEGEVEEDAPQPTLGTMLIQLGIAPDTLGWDDEEGTFVER